MEETLGMRLRRLRGDRKQIDVAKAIGIDNSVLSRLESDDKKKVDPDVLRRFAEYYDVTTDFLLTGKYSIKDAVNDNFDPELADLLYKVRKKGAELEATTLLRSVAEGKMTKAKLRDILRAFDIIDRDDD